MRKTKKKKETHLALVRVQLFAGPQPIDQIRVRAEVPPHRDQVVVHSQALVDVLVVVTTSGDDGRGGTDGFAVRTEGDLELLERVFLREGGELLSFGTELVEAGLNEVAVERKKSQFRGRLKKEGGKRRTRRRDPSCSAPCTAPSTAPPSASPSSG
jgi:hypothetical protein